MAFTELDLRTVTAVGEHRSTMVCVALNFWFGLHVLSEKQSHMFAFMSFISP